MRKMRLFAAAVDVVGSKDVLKSVLPYVAGVTLSVVLPNGKSVPVVIGKNDSDDVISERLLKISQLVASEYAIPEQGKQQVEEQSGVEDTGDGDAVMAAAEKVRGSAGKLPPDEPIDVGLAEEIEGFRTLAARHVKSAGDLKVSKACEKALRAMNELENTGQVNSILSGMISMHGHLASGNADPFLLPGFWNEFWVAIQNL